MLHFSGPWFILELLDPDRSIQEPKEETNVAATICFHGYIAQTSSEGATFELIILNSSTASLNQDFFTNTSYFTVQVGAFEGCMNITIIGNEILEKDEVIAYEVRSFVQQDFATPGSITIVDKRR